MEPLKYKATPIPVLPLREVVVFPQRVVTLFVARDVSIAALKAVGDNGEIFLVAQRDAKIETPATKDLYTTGCVAKILQCFKLPDKSYKILVEGQARAAAAYTYKRADSFISASIQKLAVDGAMSSDEANAYFRALRKAVRYYAKFHKKIGEELLVKLANLKTLPEVLSSLSGAFPMANDKRQQLLEITDEAEWAHALLQHVNKENEISQIEHSIRRRVKDQVEKNHREYYLQEQMRAIQKEMGDDDNNELDAYKKRINESGMSKQAQQKCEKELKKLRQMSAMSAEATVVRSYLDTVLSLPWQARTPTKVVAAEARRRLNTDHDGLEKVKEHIMEYLAVQRRVPNSRAPVLCFVGPPGVGKTSLGQSIAAATGRVFGRISLGGVRDEAEIRGHRRTYIGSLPGKIISTMARAEVKNPLILLDEIDKMGLDFRGDPSAALLEVLDREQNATFSDHYIELDFDLSEVMFITTANTMNIPPALMDRLEIIRISGYTEEEKVRIAKNHLIRRQFKESGLQANEAKFNPAAIRDIVRYYTREAGVRNLERSIGRICRKLVLQIEEHASASEESPAPILADVVADTNKARDGDGDTKRVDKKSSAHIAAKTGKASKVTKSISVTAKSLEQYLGVPRYRHTLAAKQSRLGQVNGLAWTEVGGDLLSVEACLFPGKGNTIRTGKLGEVIRESVATALTVVRSRAGDFNIETDLFKNNDFHIHFPEGAIPKDGPSAGIATATALLSIVTNIPVRYDIAMTGEITLRGEVLPIGGVKEKLLAALRSGISEVVLPHGNKKDLADIPDEILGKLTIHTVKWIDEVFNLALVNIPHVAADAAGKDSKNGKKSKPAKPVVKPIPGDANAPTHLPLQ